MGPQHHAAGARPPARRRAAPAAEGGLGRASSATTTSLLCPVTPTPAIPHDHNPDVDARTITVNGAARPYGDQFAWLQAIGVVHLPVVVAPVGLTPAGLPVGIQIVAPHLEDRTAIDVARRIAEVVGGFQAPLGF